MTEEIVIPESAKTEVCENYFVKFCCHGGLKEMIALSDPDCYDEFWHHISVLQKDGIKIVCHNNVYLFEEDLEAYAKDHPEPECDDWRN